MSKAVVVDPVEEARRAHEGPIARKIAQDAQQIVERRECEQEVESLEAQRPVIEDRLRAAVSEHTRFVEANVVPAQQKLAELQSQAAELNAHAKAIEAEGLRIRDRIAALTGRLERYDRDARGRLTPEALERACSRVHRDEKSSTVYCGVRVSGDLRALTEIALDEARVASADLRAWREDVLAAIAPGPGVS